MSWEEKLVRSHTQLFKEKDNRDKHSHESHRCKRRDGYAEQILENGSYRSPLTGHNRFGDDTRTIGVYLTWSRAFSKSKEQRGKKWKY